MTINETKFYRPRRPRLTKHERMFAREGLVKEYRRNTGLDVPDFDFLAPDTERPIMSRRIGMQYLQRSDDWEPEFFGMGPFQITYNFSSAVRNNMFPLKERPKNELSFASRKAYGAPGWSFRMLYEFLCEAYNNGVPFVDTYFDRVFSTRPVYVRFRAIYDEIQDAINDEQYALFMSVPQKADGTPDERYAPMKRFKNFKVWKDPIVRQTCKSIAKEIRHDIEVCLSTGRLPLREREGATISASAKKLRDTLGGMKHHNQLFYASGQLIGHLNVFVEIGEKAA